MNSSSKGIFKSIIGVVASNITTIISGIIIGFIIPKVISVDGFGLFKTFSLYTTYVGLFSVGIIDGIVLKYGGKDYNQYDLKLFRSYFRWYLFVHIIWATLIAITVFYFNDNNYKFIVLMLSIYLIFSNVVGYFQQISQITQRFKEYSLAKIIQSVMKVFGGFLMIVLYFVSNQLVDYKIYVILIILGLVIVTIGYVRIYKDIIFGVAIPLADTKKDIINLSKIGFPLMFANLCATFILTLDRQFVNVLFSNSEYAIYAFAYNLLSLITVATSAISTVLYPVLKRTSVDKLKTNYSSLVGIMLLFVFGMLIVYFPLCMFINWFLPQYTNSLIILRIILPGLAISSSITVIMHNYYKTLGVNIIYFKKSVIILLVSALANGIAYICFKTTVSISIASIIVMVIWYLYIEQFFILNYGYYRWRNLVYLLLLMVLFYLITLINNLIVSAIIYFAVYCLITTVFQKNALTYLKSLIIKE